MRLSPAPRLGPSATPRELSSARTRRRQGPQGAVPQRPGTEVPAATPAQERRWPARAEGCREGLRVGAWTEGSQPSSTGPPPAAQGPPPTPTAAWLPPRHTVLEAGTTRVQEALSIHRAGRQLCCRWTLCGTSVLSWGRCLWASSLLLNLKVADSCFNEFTAAPRLPASGHPAGRPAGGRVWEPTRCPPLRRAHSPGLPWLTVCVRPRRGVLGSFRVKTSKPLSPPGPSCSVKMGQVGRGVCVQGPRATCPPGTLRGPAAPLGLRIPFWKGIW